MPKIARILTLALAAMCLTACGFTGNLRGNPGFASFGAPSLVKDTDREFAISLGPIPVRLATMLSRPIIGYDEPWIPDTLSDIRAVRVYAYDIEGRPDLMLSHLESVRSQLEIEGWESIAVVREDGGLVSALVRSEWPDLIRGVVVIYEEDEDLVLVNVIGKLEPETVGKAMSAFGFELPLMSFDSEQTASTYTSF